MELYVLDPLNRRQYVIDQFTSLIWTERWQAYGDFQLNTVSNYAMRSLLKPDTWLAMNRSNYVMRVESVEDDFNDDGTRALIIKGRSIEGIFDDRVSASLLWTNPPAVIARDMFHEVCVGGTWDAEDIIPGIVEGTFLPASTILEPADAITIDYTGSTPPTLFGGMVTDVCAKYDLGFRILRQDSNAQLYFDIYAGSDRTTDQTILPPVVFAPQLDNLQNTKELTDISTAKNVAYVLQTGGVITKVYGVGVDPTTSSFERRVLIVDATNLTSPTTAQLTQAGLEALAGARTNYLFDGEVSQIQSQYKYGADYNLGDLIEQQNTDGVQSDMRVTEQIFSQDSTGEFSYPTLANYDTINSGTWLGWNNNKAWFDLDSDETTWSEEP